MKGSFPTIGSSVCEKRIGGRRVELRKKGKKVSMEKVKIEKQSKMNGMERNEIE